MRLGSFVIVAVALFVSACGGGGSPDAAQTTDAGQTTQSSIPAVKVLLAKLTDVGSQDGNLTLLPEGDDRTRVIVSFPVPGEQGPVYSVSFRHGTCAAPGDTVLELPTHEDGVTQTVVERGVDDLRAQAFVIASKEDETALFCGVVPTG